MMIKKTTTGKLKQQQHCVHNRYYLDDCHINSDVTIDDIEISLFTK